MQILKSKKDRIPDFSQFVDTRPDLPTLNMDDVVNKHSSLKRASTDFKNEEGKTATEQYNEMLDKKVDILIARYPPHFATGEYLPLTNRQDKYVSWNEEALKIFIRSGSSYFNPFDGLVRQLNKRILEWARVDSTNLDSISLQEQVDKALTEFAYQYLKDVENNTEN